MSSLIIAGLLLCCSSYAFAQQPLNIMSFNLRYNNPDDSANAWPHRKDMVAAEIRFHQAQIIGMQEALYDMILDLQSRLNGYQWVGVGRDDGKKAGEFNPVFYDTHRLQALEHHTFWLSEHPEQAGVKGWDAVCNRIVTWIHFKDLATGKQFYYFNTHFDHMGTVARRESAHLLLNRIKAIAGNSPVIVTGDFNAHPSDEPIRIITRADDPAHLTDSKAVSVSPHYGPAGTFTDFGRLQDSSPIDHIFIKNKVTVTRHATLSETWNGKYSSDHFPVLATVVLQ